MNQNELFVWFQEEFKKNNDAWFRVSELIPLVEENEGNLRKKIIKLYAWGYLERRFQGLALLYRLKPVHKDTIILKSPLDSSLTSEEYKKLG